MLRLLTGQSKKRANLQVRNTTDFLPPHPRQLRQLYSTLHLQVEQLPARVTLLPRSKQPIAPVSPMPDRPHLSDVQPSKSLTLGQKLLAVARLRCPVCWQGPMFRTPLSMYPRCPHCQVQFDKKHGYFLGAMYASYGISLLICGAETLILVLRGAPSWLTILCVTTTALIVGPLIAFPYSRVLWVWAERDGHLHDGEEDVARLKRAHQQAHGMRVKPSIHALDRDSSPPKP